jgi:hypothetical protein
MIATCAALTATTMGVASAADNHNHDGKGKSLGTYARRDASDIASYWDDVVD